MTTTVVFSSSGDGYLNSEHATYAGMFNGTSVTLVSGSNTGMYGRNATGGDYQGFEPFFAFTFPTPTDVVTSAYLRLRTATVTSTGFVRALYIAQYAYGTLTTADWRTPAQHIALTQLGRVEAVNGSTGKYIRCGSDELVAAVQSSTLLECLLPVRRHGSHRGRNRLVLPERVHRHGR